MPLITDHWAFWRCTFNDHDGGFRSRTKEERDWDVIPSRQVIIGAITVAYRLLARSRLEKGVVYVYRFLQIRSIHAGRCLTIFRSTLLSAEIPVSKPTGR